MGETCIHRVLITIQIPNTDHETITNIQRKFCFFLYTKMSCSTSRIVITIAMTMTLANR